MKLNRDLTCADLVELLTAFLDGTLSAADCERFEEHIAYCEWCVTYLDQMRETIASVGRLEEDDLSPEAQTALLDAFHDWRDG
jgi:anti-sigma factor RsiW